MGVESRLSEFVIEGKTRHEVAEELGVSYNTVRWYEYQENVKLRNETERDFRAEVQGMKPLDAVEMLLDKIELLQEALTPSTDDFSQLTPKHARLARTLHNAGSRGMSDDALMSALYWDKAGDWPQPLILRTMISKLRRELPEWKFERLAEGYRMVRANSKGELK